MQSKRLGTLSAKEQKLVKNFLMTLGKLIQEARHMKKITQEELAEMLEVNVNTINRLFPKKLRFFV